MKPTNNFLGNNIKFLRRRQHLTQESLATQLSITRSKLNCIETGQTRSPAIEDLLNFSNFFRMSLDTLVKVDLSQLGELRIRDLEAGNDVYTKGGNLRILAISIDHDHKEQVEYVPIKAKAGYIAGFNDVDFIAALEKYSVPNLPKHGTYRIFATKGDSMLPIPEGSDITARYEEDWTAIKAGTPCILILNGQQDFVFKMVTAQRDHTFLLESLNPVYEPYTVHAADILEIWSFHAFTSREIPLSSGMDVVLQEIRELRSMIRAARS
ncbi:MAG: helix-turn-helix domain-containing protein [Taibaiella sp.]|nr:helix-turn-helix domain-containing protein [Taibaiella sp.]